MADKYPVLILKVDLDCHLCYKKIKKVLCKLQEKEDVKAIFYDEKNKSIMISGPFNPEKVSSWLCCRAGKVIKDIDIKNNPKDKSKDSKPADGAKPPKDGKAKDDKPKDGKAKDDKPKDGKAKDDKPKDGKPKDGKSKDDKPKDDKPKDGKGKGGKSKDEKPKNDNAKDEKPKGDKAKTGKFDPDQGNMMKDEGPKVKFDPKPIMIPQKIQMEALKNEFGLVGGYPQMSYQPGWPAGPMGSMGPMGPVPPSCCFRPFYEGFHGGYRCCTCGTVFGYGVAAPPAGYYGGPAPVDSYKGNQYFCEEEPSCSIM